MRNITLVCTTHEEKGKCNSNELYKIIERINPGIIFQEISPSLFDRLYKEPITSNLEAHTIKKYIQKHKVEHIPVDNDDPVDIRFKKDVDSMLDVMYDYSKEYCDLDKEIFYLTYDYGFPYLNSEQCSDTFHKQHVLEENIIKSINDDKLNCTYNLWNESNDKRENGIINKIYNDEHVYKKAILLIGAAHRKSIINKIKERDEKKEMNWEFYGFK